MIMTRDMVADYSHWRDARLSMAMVTDGELLWQANAGGEGGAAALNPAGGI
jgi:hypothetical protein